MCMRSFQKLYSDLEILIYKTLPCVNQTIAQEYFLNNPGRKANLHMYVGGLDDGYVF